MNTALPQLNRLLAHISNIGAIALEATFGDPARAADAASARSALILAVPCLGLALLCACVFAEALFPVKSGYILGFLVGAVLGSAGWVALGAIAYFPFSLLSPGATLGDFIRWHGTGAGPLMVSAVLSVVLHLGSIYYFKLPWYSGSIFLILGLVWSSFSMLRIVHAKIRGKVGLVFLGFYFALVVPTGVGYLLPVIAQEVVSVLQDWGLMKDVVLTL